MGKATGGWGVSGTSIYQTGYPFTVFNFASFTGGGDYNADGDNLDYPNAGSYTSGNIQRCVSDRHLHSRASSPRRRWAQTETKR